MNRQLEKARAEISAWAGRPPARSPEMARASVETLVRRDRWIGWKAAVSSAAVVALMATALLSVPALRPNRGPLASASVVALSEADGSLLVYELRSGAKLYLTLTGKTINGEDVNK